MLQDATTNEGYMKIDCISNLHERKALFASGDVLRKKIKS